MDGFANISTDALMRAAAANRPKRRGVGDFNEPTIMAVRPATSAPQPPGPADFPVAVAPGECTMATLCALMQRLLQELINQSVAAEPVIRAKAATDVGQTLDWSSRGTMDRLMMRNKGTNSVWFGFDQNGPSVNAVTTDLSFELQANESVNLAQCAFDKIGLKCAAGETATVHAIAFQSVAGNQAASIS